MAVMLKLLFHRARAQHQIYPTQCKHCSCKLTSVCSFLYSSSKAFECTICTIFYISIAKPASIPFLGVLSWQEELTLRSIQRNNMNLTFFRIRQSQEENLLVCPNARLQKLSEGNSITKLSSGVGLYFSTYIY